jgi:hypothetical protein
MSKGSISKKKNPTPEEGIRKNEKEEDHQRLIGKHVKKRGRGLFTIDARPPDRDLKLGPSEHEVELLSTGPPG